MMNWKTMVAAALPLLVVPTTVSAGASTTLVFVGEACMDYDGIAACFANGLSIETGTGLGTYDDSGTVIPLTWRWEPLMKGAVMEFDLSGIAPDLLARAVAIPRASGVVGGLSVWQGTDLTGFGVGTIDFAPAP